MPSSAVALTPDRSLLAGDTGRRQPRSRMVVVSAQLSSARAVVGIDTVVMDKTGDPDQG